MDHLLQRDGFDKLRGLGIRSGTDRVERVEIRRQRPELDTDRGLQHGLRVLHGVERR